MIHNELAERWEQRYNDLDDYTKERLDRLSELGSDRINLNVIKRKRPKINRGDVFVVSFTDNLYFVGLVLKSNYKNCMGDGMVTGVIYNIAVSSPEEVCDEILDFRAENILVGPAIFTRSDWTMGAFYNVGNSEACVPDYDYGFCKLYSQDYYNEYGEKLDYKPKKIGRYYGLITWFGIAQTLNKELIIDHSFLSENLKKTYEEYLNHVLYGTFPTEEIDTEYYPFQFYENENKTYGLALIELDKVACYIRNINPVIDGNGFDWEDVIKTYLKEKHADRKHKVKFDSEADMMYMYSRDKELMELIAMDLSKLVKSGEIKSYIMHTKFKDYD